MRIFAGSVLIFLALTGCPKKAEPAAEEKAAKAEVPEVPSIVVKKDRTDLLFSYVDATGAFHDTNKIEDVPEASRAQVLVRDLSKSPDELKTSDYLYVADLRTPDDKGVYPCGAISRWSFEKRGAHEAATQVAQNTAEAGGQVVTLYTTSWCGVCKQAKAFLKKQGVPFLERDVETEAGAADEMQRKAQAAGLRTQGVPVIDVGGELMLGFDSNALDGLLKKKGLSKAP